MTWFNPPSNFERLLAVVFILLYLAYVVRVWVLARAYRLDVGGLLKKMILRTAYFVLLLIALLGPTFGDVKKEMAVVGKDVFVILDLSLSMNTEDVSPSRFVAAKEEIRSFIHHLNPNDRIGLILFDDQTQLLCPLTYDRSALELFLDGLNSANVAHGGSALNEALRIAYSKFQAENKLGNTLGGKLVVLVSDGEYPIDEVKKTISLYSQANIKLFSLAVGTVQGGKIPLSNSYKRKANGSYVVSKLNVDFFDYLSEETRGNYLKINNGNANMGTKLSHNLNKIDGEFRTLKKKDISANKYYYFLLAALVLILIDGVRTVAVIKL